MIYSLKDNYIKPTFLLMLTARRMVMVWAKDRIERQINRGSLKVGKSKGTWLKAADLKLDHASIEVHLSSVFREWKTQIAKPIDPAVELIANENYYDDYVKNNTRIIELELEDNHGKYFLLKPNQLVLCDIYEYIELPDTVFASIESKSKIARLGVSVHNAAPSVHPTYNGNLTLEIVNHSHNDMILRPYDEETQFGTCVAQIFFENVEQGVDIKGIVDWLCHLINYGFAFHHVIELINSFPSIPFLTNEDKEEIIKLVTQFHSGLSKTGTGG